MTGKAIDFYERDLKITVAALGENHPDVAASYNNLGVVYKNKGEYDKAIDFYERSLSINIASLGLEHPESKKLTNIYIYYNLRMACKRGEGKR